MITSLPLSPTPTVVMSTAPPVARQKSTRISRTASQGSEMDATSPPSQAEPQLTSKLVVQQQDRRSSEAHMEVKHFSDVSKLRATVANTRACSLIIDLQLTNAMHVLFLMDHLGLETTVVK